jgi:purine nucleoside phosphorylase
MPEAALARERGIEYASLCVVVNMAAGLNAEAISTAAISVVLEQAMGRVGQIIKSLLELESEV